MARRYSDIKKAAQLQTALTNYIAHISTPQPRRLNSRGARDLSKIVYLAPFTVTVAADEVVMARANPAHWTKLNLPINATVLADITDNIGAKELVDLGRFTPARVVLFENATRVVTTPTSDVTGLQYLKYAGDRFSLPFGAASETADLIDAYLEVKAAVLASGTTVNAAVKRVSLVREKAST